jgi:hypothetical protein
MQHNKLLRCVVTPGREEVTVEAEQVQGVHSVTNIIRVTE